MNLRRTPPVSFDERTIVALYASSPAAPRPAARNAPRSAPRPAARPAARPAPRAAARPAPRAAARPAARRLGAVAAVIATTVALSITSAPLAQADPALTAPTLQTKTFTSTAGVQSWTVPGDSTVELMVSLVGGQGGRGGFDGSTTPAEGGYVGVVSGTLSVPGGTTLQIAVGAGGATGASSVKGVAGGVGGANSLGGYGGGRGGATGTVGTSGAGGGGGAATVLTIGGVAIIAGGAGGGGGSGNGGVLTGRAAEAAYSAAHSSANTSGTAGGSVPASGNQLDGGGAGGGGGGATGGEGGHIEYGSGSTMEWFGYGGYPGANSTGGYGTLSGAYQYYSGNGAAGSVTIRYVDGPPAAARHVSGRTGSVAGTVDLRWDAPVNSGLDAVTGYAVQYSADGGDTWQDATLATLATGAQVSATVTGLTGGAEYLFRVAAKNGYAGNGGYGAWSVPSAAIAAPADGAAPPSPWAGGDAPAAHAHVVPGDDSIAIVWDDNTAPDSYIVHVYDGSAAEVTGSPLACAGADRCVLSGLLPGDYTVVLQTPGDESAPTAIPPFDPEGANSYGTGDPELTRNEDGTITVSWPKPAAPPSGDYRVHLYDDDGEIATSPLTCTGPDACATGYLDPDTAYQVTIEVPARTDPAPVTISASTTTWSDPQDPPAGPHTGAPTALAVTALDSALSIAFTAPTAQPDGNEILYYQYSTDGGATWANSGAFGSPAGISNLVNGTGYSVRLRAMTLQGPGDPSTPVTGTPRGYPSAPYSGGNPAGISATHSGSSATVTWAPYRANGSAITGYTVTAFNAPSAGSSVATCTATGAGDTCTLSGLSGTVYLSVQAVNGVGASPRSDPRIPLDMAATAPGAPGKPALSGGRLAWSPPTGTATAYQVQYSTDGGDTYLTILPSSGPTASGGIVSAGLATLPGAGGYLFRVRAQNGALIGPWSEPSDLLTIPEPRTPVLGPVTRTAGGFTTAITNYDGSLGWAVSASPGVASIDADGLVTVTGLAASQSATVTVTATAFGTGSRSAAKSGTSLGGTAPELGAVTPARGGFTVRIVNWSVYKNGRYGAHTLLTPVVKANPDGVTPSFAGPDATGLVTVTGLGDAHQITLAYAVTADGHTPVTGLPVVGASLLEPVGPLFEEPIPTAGGFTVRISNFDGSGATAYQLAVQPGHVSGPDDSGIITVSGLGSAAAATVTVTATQDGHAPGLGTVTGTALVAVAPSAGTPTPPAPPTDKPTPPADKPAPPAVHELPAGGTAITRDGVSVPSAASAGSQGVTVSWQEMTMTALRLDGGTPVPPGAGGTAPGRLTVPFTGTVQVDVSGFAAGTRAQIWAFSTPTLLATVAIDRAKHGVAIVDLPEAVIVGQHTLVARGVNAAGAEIVMSTGMTVTPLGAEPDQTTVIPQPEATVSREVLSYTGVDAADQLRVAATLLLTGVMLVVLTGRRRWHHPLGASAGSAAGFGPEPARGGSTVLATGGWQRTAPAPGPVATALATAPALATALALAPAGFGPAVPAAGPAAPARRLLPPRDLPSGEWMALVFSVGAS